MNPSAPRKLILGGVLAVLAGWLVIPRLIHNTGPAPAQAADTDTTRSADRDAELLLPILAAAPAAPAVPLAAEWAADPFHRLRPATAPDQPQTPVQPGQPPAALVLEGILNGAAPSALISGQIAGVGDRLPGGYTVAAIDAYSVTLDGPQGPWTLKLPQ
jgi:hypothetical protein